MGAERQSKALVNVLEDAGDFAPSQNIIWLDSGKAVELFVFCIVVIGELERKRW